jgi:hypothetical protein
MPAALKTPENREREPAPGIGGFVMPGLRVHAGSAADATPRKGKEVAPVHVGFQLPAPARSLAAARCRSR